jgi:copper chaperone CopZ
MKKAMCVLASLWLAPAWAGDVVKIGVTGMVCEFCAASVEKGLKKLPGVAKVEVSMKDKRAEIVMTDGNTLDAEQARKVILDAGFTPGELHIQ